VDSIDTPNKGHTNYLASHLLFDVLFFAKVFRNGRQLKAEDFLRLVTGLTAYKRIIVTSFNLALAVLYF